jgi:hypothetical protein
LENQLSHALARGLITQNETIDHMLSANAQTDSVAELMAKMKLSLQGSISRVQGRFKALSEDVGNLI